MADEKTETGRIASKKQGGLTHSHTDTPGAQYLLLGHQFCSSSSAVGWVVGSGFWEDSSNSHAAFIRDAGGTGARSSDFLLVPFGQSLCPSRPASPSAFNGRIVVVQHRCSVDLLVARLSWHSAFQCSFQSLIHLLCTAQCGVMESGRCFLGRLAPCSGSSGRCSALPRRLICWMTSLASESS